MVKLEILLKLKLKKNSFKTKFGINGLRDIYRFIKEEWRNR